MDQIHKRFSAESRRRDSRDMIREGLIERESRRYWGLARPVSLRCSRNTARNQGSSPSPTNELRRPSCLQL